jgi:small redox-active disulfide protein 2
MSVSVKILGSGCAKCHQLLEITKAAVKEAGIDANVEDIQDIKKIISYNVISTPALVINEKVVSTGKVLSKKEVTQILQKAAAG